MVSDALQPKKPREIRIECQDHLLTISSNNRIVSQKDIGDLISLPELSRESPIRLTINAEESATISSFKFSSNSIQKYNIVADENTKSSNNIAFISIANDYNNSKYSLDTVPSKESDKLKAHYNRMGIPTYQIKNFTDKQALYESINV